MIFIKPYQNIYMRKKEKKYKGEKFPKKKKIKSDYSFTESNDNHIIEIAKK